MPGFVALHDPYLAEMRQNPLVLLIEDYRRSSTAQNRGFVPFRVEASSKSALQNMVPF